MATTATTTSVIDDIDFEISETDDVDRAIMEHFNEFESVEIQFEDDLSKEDFLLLEKKKNTTLLLDSIPPLMFCDEANVQCVVNANQSSSPPKQIKYFCDYCSKPYKRETAYVKHMSACSMGGSKSENTKSKLNQKESATKTVNKEAGFICVKADFNFSLVRKALDMLVADKIYNVKTKFETPGQKVKKFAQELIRVFTENPDLLKETERELLSRMINAMKDTNLTKGAMRENMWNKILQIQQDSRNIERWNNVLSQCKESIPTSTFSSLFHYLTTKMVFLILENNNVQNQKEAPMRDIKLSDDEQNVLYYVSGFIIFYMKRKFQKIFSKNKNNTAAIAALQFLSNLHAKSNEAVKGHSFLDFTKKWADVKNNGGLVMVNDEFYLFIRRIENAVRQILTIDLICSYKQEDIRDVVRREIEKAALVNQYWETLIRFLPNKDLGNVLKDQIITKWIDLRCHAFVKTYIQILRRKFNQDAATKAKSTISKSAEPALRKTLT